MKSTNGKSLMTSIAKARVKEPKEDKTYSMFLKCHAKSRSCGCIPLANKH
jgi:hypothetical protein